MFPFAAPPSIRSLAALALRETLRDVVRACCTVVAAVQVIADRAALIAFDVAGFEALVEQVRISRRERGR